MAGSRGLSSEFGLCWFLQALLLTISHSTNHASQRYSFIVGIPQCVLVHFSSGVPLCHASLKLFWGKFSIEKVFTVGLVEPSAEEALTDRLVLQSVFCWNHCLFCFCFLEWLDITNARKRTKIFVNSSCLGNRLQLSGCMWACAIYWTNKRNAQLTEERAGEALGEAHGRSSYWELVPIFKTFSAPFMSKAWHTGRAAAFLSTVSAHHSLTLRIGKLSQ